MSDSDTRSIVHRMIRRQTQLNALDQVLNLVRDEHDLAEPLKELRTEIAFRLETVALHPVNPEQLRQIAAWLKGDAKEADELDDFDVAADALEAMADGYELVFIESR